MKNLLKTLALAVVLVAGAAQAKVKVVATLGDLGALARAVGGDDVRVTVMAEPTQDPHFVDPRPNLVLEASNADLLILNGMELEIGWLPTILTASRNGNIQPGNPGYLDASTAIQPREVPLQKIDRSMGDIHPEGNPHFTLDPENGGRIARAIAARLEALDPEHAADFKKNLAAFEQALGAKNAEWKKALAPFKGTQVVPYHKSWIYFTEWAGLDEVGFIEPKPGLPPSAGQVAKVLGILKSRNVPLLIQEEWYPAATSELLVRNSRAKLVRVVGQTPANQTYLQHLDQLVEKVLAALKT